MGLWRVVDADNYRIRISVKKMVGLAANREVVAQKFHSDSD